LFDSSYRWQLMHDALSTPPLADGSIREDAFAAFFGAGGLTVYSSCKSPWRWVICAGQNAVQARVIDPESFYERAARASVTPAPRTARSAPRKFEQSLLVRWLTRALQPPEESVTLYSTLAEEEDIAAFLTLVHFSREEWDAINALPSLTAAEIRHFAQSHNAALSDIESAFLPAKLDLAPALADFYIASLTRARRDVEAALIIAQATHSTRLPRLMADALAVGAFEGAGHAPMRHEGEDYATSILQDTSIFTDAAMTAATERMALPIDHMDHLLRMDIMAISRLAAEIVEQHCLSPAALLRRAQHVFLARADVCRFPPLHRFALAVHEGDLNVQESWVQRTGLAYNRLFEGKALPLTALDETVTDRVAKTGT
jgi:hypothetical protein